MTGAEQIARTYRELADLRATGESPDGLVTATVGAHGDLRDLTLDPRVYRNADSDELTAQVLAAARAAADHAGGTAIDMIDALLPDQVDPEHVDLVFDPALYELDRVLAAPAPRVPTGGRDLPTMGDGPDYAALRRELLTKRDMARRVRVTETSDDGLVSATTDGYGRLHDLTLHPRIYRTTDSRALARTIAGTVSRAGQLARDQVQAGAAR